MQLSNGVPAGYSLPANWGNNLDQDWVGHVGAIRMIVFQGSDTPAQVADWVEAMQDRGFYTIITIAPPSQTWFNQTLQEWSSRVAAYVNAASPNVWSIGNEPGATLSAGSGASPNGPYWDKFKAAADIIHSSSPGVPVALAGPRHDQAVVFYNNANANNVVRDGYADMWDAHVYYHTPAQNLQWIQARRAQVNAFANSWLPLPMLITEFGWSVKKGAGIHDNMVVPPGTATDTTEETQAGHLYDMFTKFRTNREPLKLRAACWYQGFDSGWMNTQNGWCGVIKDHRTDICGPTGTAGPCPPNAGANHWTASNPTAARKPAYFRLTTLPFAPTTDGVAATPPAITYPPTPATVINTNSARLWAYVDPNTEPTTRFFEWGTTLAYGATGSPSPGASVGAGDVPFGTSYPITGLLPGQTYHFRCYAINSVTGRTNGADKTFTTASVPLPPVVTTGSATGITVSGATLNGLVDPQSAATGAYFEYGLTSAYGSRTPATDIAVGSGNSPISVSAPLTGLTLGQVYHYRLRATNAQGTTLGNPPGDPSFSTVAPAPPADLARPVLPSLDLSVEIQTADGRTFRWDPDDEDLLRRPYEIQFSTAAGDGFAEASCVLYRPIDLDYADLRLLTRGRFIGTDAQTAYEGRIVAMPRSVDTAGERIQVNFSSLMSSARDRPFVEIYADRSGDRWGTAPLSMRLIYANASVPLDSDFVPQVDVGSLSIKGITGKQIRAPSTGELYWQAPSGCKAAFFEYQAIEKGVVVNTEVPTLYSRQIDTAADYANMGTWDSTPMTFTGVPHNENVDPPTNFLGIRLRAASTIPLVDNDSIPIQWVIGPMCVYGDHGVPRQDNGDEPRGVYASDVIKNIVDRFCPLLDASEIADTDVMVEHLVFDTPTMPFDAMTLLNGYHLWQLAAWEDGKIQFEPADLSKTDWVVRTDDLGVTMDLQGDSVDEFANGIVVSYTDVAERAQVLWPKDPATGTVLNSALLDEDPNNPANREGIDRWPVVLELSNPATANGALQLGRVALAEFNRAKAPGTINVSGGYIMDEQSNFQPSYKVRAGQTLSITDLPNESPRLITATSWSEDGTLSITLEQPPSRVDAVLARFAIAAASPGG